MVLFVQDSQILINLFLRLGVVRSFLLRCPHSKEKGGARKGKGGERGAGSELLSSASRNSPATRRSPGNLQSIGRPNYGGRGVGEGEGRRQSRPRGTRKCCGEERSVSGLAEGGDSLVGGACWDRSCGGGPPISRSRLEALGTMQGGQARPVLIMPPPPPSVILLYFVLSCLLFFFFKKNKLWFLCVQVYF